VAISPEMSGIWDEQYTKYNNRIVKVRKLTEGLVRTFNLGDISVNFYLDTKEGREKLARKIDKKTGEWTDKVDKRRRVVTFSLTKDQEIENRSCTFYLEGSIDKEKGIATPVPIAACGAAGISVLNLFDLTLKGAPEEKIDSARRNAARGIIAISGTLDNELIEELVKKIEETENKDLLNLSGKLFIKLRPVNIQEILLYHERELEVLRAL